MYSYEYGTLLEMKGRARRCEEMPLGGVDEIVDGYSTPTSRRKNSLTPTHVRMSSQPFVLHLEHWLSIS